jgi:hypothetical protein
VKHFDKADDSKTSPPILDFFYDKFVMTNAWSNRTGKLRGKQYNTPYKLNDSVKDLAKTPAERKTSVAKIKAEVLKTKDFLADIQIQGTGEVSAYDGRNITTKADAESVMSANPNNVYIYNIQTQRNDAGGISYTPNSTGFAFYDADAPNKVGLPIVQEFGKPYIDKDKGIHVTDPKSVTDVDGVISEEVRLGIEDAITQIKQLKAEGKKIWFDQNGYGQTMLGKYQGKQHAGKETFLYLSKRLYEEFGFINPKFLATNTGKVQVQSGQEISDDLVREFMTNICG